jgi:hypothetical protein
MTDMRSARPNFAQEKQNPPDFSDGFGNGYLASAFGDGLASGPQILEGFFKAGGH